MASATLRMPSTEQTPVPASVPVSVPVPMSLDAITPATSSMPPTGNLSIAPRKFKASELPLSSATRSAIDGLAHSFKKKGGYDAIRKQIWEKFEASVRLAYTSFPEGVA